MRIRMYKIRNNTTDLTDKDCFSLINHYYNILMKDIDYDNVRKSTLIKYQTNYDYIISSEFNGNEQIGFYIYNADDYKIKELGND